MESLSQKRYRQSEKGKAYLRKYRREWARKTNTPEKNRNRNLKKNHGITLEQFSQMYEAQDGICPICKRELETSGRGVHVDHDHETGKNRDLLCSNCNLMIG
jgi:DNA repair exonuclease SbcCD ATPase subunit